MYNSIFRLKEMLDNENIPYEFLDRSNDFGLMSTKHYQIVVYKPNKKNERLISVIEGTYTYGGDEDLLEIMGCLTEEEQEFDDVLGHLTSDEVFNRIKTNYRKLERGEE